MKTFLYFDMKRTKKQILSINLGKTLAQSLKFSQE